MRNKTRLLRSLQGLAALSSTLCMMSTSMPAKGKCRPKARANRLMVREPSPDGDQHVMTTGSQVVARRDIIARSIIRRGSQADVQYADLPNMLGLNVLVQSSPKPRMWSGKSPRGPMKTKNGMTINGSLRSMKRPKARKAKGEDLSQRGSLRARMLQGRLLQDRHSLHRRRETDLIPKPNLNHGYLNRVFINGVVSLQWVLANPAAFVFLVDAVCEAFDNGQLVRHCGRGFAACVKRQLAGSTLE